MRLLEVDQAEPVLEFGVFGPACDRGLADAFRFGKATLLKVAEDESAVGFQAVRRKLPGLLEVMGCACEVACVESILPLADKHWQGLILR